MSTRRLIVPASVLVLLVIASLQDTSTGTRLGAVPAAPLSPPSVPSWTDIPVLPEARLPAYLPGQVMVAADDLDAVARRIGATVLKPVGPSGYGALATPDGMDDADFRASLRGMPEVRDAAPIGRIVGAGKSGSTTTTASTTTTTGRANPLQWHLDFAEAPYASTQADGVVVAVVDSGMAYKKGKEGGQAFVQAPTLAGVPIVSPWDFVEGDATPFDEHQHGTHIASIIASSGRVEGVSAGVSLMPLRVLDAENQGTELDLIDALVWARDHGAQVINLSLCFSPEYAPSRALATALNEAAEAGIVIVAAAGNDGVGRVSYPAAHPRVIAVGAVTPASSAVGEVAWYSNYGPRLDVMAPGGDPSSDHTSDGYVDGILAETINYQDPGHTGLWFYVGTSQATAVTSGAVAHLVKLGASPIEAARGLEFGALAEAWTGAPYADGFASGRIRVDRARTLQSWGLTHSWRTLHGSLTAWLVDVGGGKVEPRVKVKVTDESGWPLWNVEALVSIHGPTDSTESCIVDQATGGCTVAGDPVDASDASAWVISLDGVNVNDAAQRPYGMFYASEGLESLVAAMQDDPTFDDAVLGFRWTAGSDPVLGEVADSVVIADMVSDTYTCPRVVLLSGSLVDEAELVDEGAIEFDGSGLITTPMFRSGASGDNLYSLVTIGTGLITTPMLRVALFPATSLEGTAVDVSALKVLDGSGLITTPMFAPVLLGRSTLDPLGASAAAGVELDGTVVGTALLDGGWLVDDTTVSSVFLASGLGGVGLEGSSFADSGTRLSD